MNKDSTPPLLPCPFCSKSSATIPPFTWWGGILGARVLGIATCRSCRRSFRRNTGKSAHLAIFLYALISTALAVFAGVAIFMYLSGRW